MKVTTKVATAPAAAGRRLGRFELKRVLGSGAEATVWLAHDTRLDREVAVKLLSRQAEMSAVHEWLNEARAVSRLTHPHIVPVFEADQHEGQAYLVFEYVPGPTLAELLRSRGALPAHEAATLMLGVLDALKTAHADGIVHRDLKPSNILVDAGGRARVMDFGIAVRISERQDLRICGTPGYMSPEAARGEPASPSMDVFAAGMTLGQVLAGTPLLRERDAMRAIHRVQHEDMAWPEVLPMPVDDALRAIVMRAVARDPGLRYADAAAFHVALLQWQQPQAEPGAAATASNSGTLEFLLRRMRHKTDFPAMSDSVARIQRVANSENESLGSLSNEILKDVALTNKLLRMVNTAHFGGGGAVSTVSRAVALVGFAGIRNMALSLVLLEHMQDKGHAQQLKEEFLRSLMAGTLADELSSGTRDGEEAFLSAMFQGLGRLLTEFYFHEEADQIRALVRPAVRSAAPPRSEDVVSQSVLGISFEALGLGVAKAWGLPDSLQRTMRKPGAELPGKPAERGIERQRWLGQAVNEVADALLYAEAVPERINEIGSRYARVLGIEPRALAAAAVAAQQRLAQLAQAMNMNVGATARARRLLVVAAPDDKPHDTLTQHQLQATLAGPHGDEAAPAEARTEVLDRTPPGQVADMLAAGIQDITNSMVADSFKLNEVLRMILETMYRALGFRRVVFCLRDPKTETLTGRFGLGEGVDGVSRAFKVPLRARAGVPPDLFSAVCIKGADTLIADATTPAMASRLPAWFREQVNAPAFLLLPMVMKGATFALIYADKAQPGGIELGEKELNLLRTLRNQAVMAFRQVA
jgi:serine/threonine protein kinase